jgi:hypothetical protein
VAKSKSELDRIENIEDAVRNLRSALVAIYGAAVAAWIPRNNSREENEKISAALHEVAENVTKLLNVTAKLGP